MRILPLQIGRKHIHKAGRRIAWALLVSAFVVGGLWMAAQATNQDLSSNYSLKPAASKQVNASGSGFSTTLAGMTPTDMNKRLDDMQATGATWVRLDLSWDAVQHSSATSYDWADSDAMVKAAEVHGFKVLLIVDFTPAWARDAGCINSKMCGPADPAAYGRFAATAARHYKPYGVENWEIWNEPNISYRFRPAADPDLYVRMLKAAYGDIKAVDPKAIVVAASTAPSETNAESYTPSDFLTAMYDAGAAGSFDAISAHPYTYPETPDQSNPADAWGQLTTMHDTMTAHGDGKKQIWITEFGAPTNGPNDPRDHMTEAVQAQMATEAIRQLHQWSWSGPLFWYDYQDVGTSTSNSENFYGLVRHDGSHKPSYDAFVQSIHILK